MQNIDATCNRIYKHLAAVIILLMQQIDVLLSAPAIKTIRGVFLCLSGRSLLCPHTQNQTPDIHVHSKQAFIHRQTRIDSHFSSPPPSTYKYPTAPTTEHGHSETHAQSVWSINVVPQGACRVTPLTGQTRLDSQQINTKHGWIPNVF